MTNANLTNSNHQFSNHQVRVRVPATTANLGPGFDSLGLALQFYNFVGIQQSLDGKDKIIATGEGASTLNTGKLQENIALLAARELLAALEIAPTYFQLNLENQIPLARGLGSSSAARVGALVAANEWARGTHGKNLDKSTLLALATKLEGHPDNVAPALLGGLIISVTQDDGGVLASRAPIAKFPRLVVFIPQNELETKTARSVLPTEIPMRDAVFNIARSGFLISILANKQWEFLGEALRDKLHQNQRASLMPAYNSVVSAATKSGAFGATLSGAGPCILAWLPDENEIVDNTIIAMQNAASECGVLGAARELKVDLEGCVVVEN